MNGKITENRFLDLLGITLELYEQHLTAKTDSLKYTYAYSAFLSLNAMLEAAANGIFTTIEDVNVEEKKYTTLDKFNLVLSHHTNRQLKKSTALYQNVDKIIKIRHELVHPKVYDKSVIYHSKQHKSVLAHEQVIPTPRKKQQKVNIQKLSVNTFFLTTQELKAVIDAVIEFLDFFFQCWEVDKDVIDICLFSQSCFGNTSQIETNHSIPAIYTIDRVDYREKLSFLNLPIIDYES